MCFLMALIMGCMSYVTLYFKRIVTFVAGS